MNVLAEFELEEKALLTGISVALLKDEEHIVTLVDGFVVMVLTNMHDDEVTVDIGMENEDVAVTVLITEMDDSFGVLCEANFNVQ